jgi:uncharacterized protein YyaL (SSP411 family)
VARPREATDNAIPSGTSLAVELLLRMAELFDDDSMRNRAVAVLETLAEPMARYATAFGHLLGAADLAVHGAVQVALVGDPGTDGFRGLGRELSSRYLPTLVLAGGPSDASAGVALLENRPAVGGQSTAYVCRHYSCQLPITDPDALGDALNQGK